jgi:hypothetical protein
MRGGKGREERKKKGRKEEGREKKREREWNDYSQGLVEMS